MTILFYFNFKGAVWRVDENKLVNDEEITLSAVLVELPLDLDTRDLVRIKQGQEYASIEEGTKGSFIEFQTDDSTADHQKWIRVFDDDQSKFNLMSYYSEFLLHGDFKDHFTNGQPNFEVYTDVSISMYNIL